MSHIPRTFVAAQVKVAPQLIGRNALFGRTNHVDGEKPFPQGNMGIVKDGASGNRILVVALYALIKKAVFVCLAFADKFKNFLTGAFGTFKPIGPADVLEMGDAGFLCGKLSYLFKNGVFVLHG